MKKEKEIHASLAVVSQTAKVVATVCDKCLVKMEKALHSYNKIFWERERDHVHITVIIHCYNCFIIVAVVNILVCLIYKLNFIIGMYIEEKR